MSPLQANTVTDIVEIVEVLCHSSDAFHRPLVRARSAPTTAALLSAVAALSASVTRTVQSAAGDTVAEAVSVPVRNTCRAAARPVVRNAVCPLHQNTSSGAAGGGSADMAAATQRVDSGGATGTVSAAYRNTSSRDDDDELAGSVSVSTSGAAPLSTAKLAPPPTTTMMRGGAARNRERTAPSHVASVATSADGVTAARFGPATAAMVVPPFRGSSQRAAPPRTRRSKPVRSATTMLGVGKFCLCLLAFPFAR